MHPKRLLTPIPLRVPQNKNSAQHVADAERVTRESLLQGILVLRVVDSRQMMPALHSAASIMEQVKRVRIMTGRVLMLMLLVVEG
jgi:hypothetical protein